MYTMRRIVWLTGLVVVMAHSAGELRAQQSNIGSVVLIPQAMPGPGATGNLGSATVGAIPVVPAAQAGAVSNAPSAVTPGTAVAPSSTACNGGWGTARGAGKAPIQLGQYGRSCANGCGSFAGNCGFIFGSCRSFFDPCGPLPLGCKKCPIHPFGHPYGTGANRCTYDSYLNH
jgi:hypothetical protein